MQNPHINIGVIGLGYVGLPLAVAFGSHYPTTGFDINAKRIAELRAGLDKTRETSAEELAEASQLHFTDQLAALRDCTVFIVTVPTPVDAFNRPDLSPLERASQALGSVLKQGDVVVFESTVYPGATEEVCVPILAQVSGLVFNEDFFVGYSPERINPGDRQHRLTTIKKVTSGSTPQAALFIDGLYRSIITAGTHLASSIKVAEAAKVIENTQRDLNIALMNELAIIFHKLGIDTTEVLEAAGTKWNFLPFKPGLVGGHCIGVDPYYLTHKAVAIGYHPEVILAGRRINDKMAQWVADDAVKLMLRHGLPVLNSKILVLGLTFKENCPDLRNSKVVDLITALQSYHAKVDVYDPLIDWDEAAAVYGLDCLKQPPALGVYDAMILAVAHEAFVAMGAEQLKAFGKPGAVIYDVKSVLASDAVHARL
jgi:UDP-N-acetyl-D-glucosamine/UDP-N-acetyl-D-galactosamine dehydrogenase